MIIFPEGHTSKTGVMMNSSRALQCWQLCQVQIVPVYNDGEYHKLFGKRLKLYVGEPMELTKEGKGLNAEYLAGECARFREAVEQLGR